MAPSATEQVRGRRTHRPGRALRPRRAGSGRRRWQGRRCLRSGTGSSGCSCCRRCRPGKLGREREMEMRLSPATASQGCIPCAPQSRAQSCHSLWLQSRPVQPAGQWQPLPSALQVAPFWQSSQVRLQSGPNVCSRQTATRGTAGENLAEAAAASWAVWAEKSPC